MFVLICAAASLTLSIGMFLFMVSPPAGTHHVVDMVGVICADHDAAFPHIMMETGVEVQVPGLGSKSPEQRADGSSVEAPTPLMVV